PPIRALHPRGRRRERPGPEAARRRRGGEEARRADGAEIGAARRPAERHPPSAARPRGANELAHHRRATLCDPDEKSGEEFTPPPRPPPSTPPARSPRSPPPSSAWPPSASPAASASASRRPLGPPLRTLCLPGRIRFRGLSPKHGGQELVSVSRL